MPAGKTNEVKEASLVPGCELASCPVPLAAGEPLGVVHDLLVDAASGRIAFVVVRRSQGPRIDHKLVAVPWPKMHWEPQHDCLVRQASTEDLKKLPNSIGRPNPTSRAGVKSSSCTTKRRRRAIFSAM